jgi:hypothetical protein
MKKGTFLVSPLLFIFLFLLAATSSASLPESKGEWSGVERIVAFGDVHGAYDEFVENLLAAGLIDKQLRWTGGKTHLVQTGDILDRGPHGRKVMDLLMTLEDQAKKAGGRVHSLIGNHEVMNLMGDMRYVPQDEIAAYANPRSEETREKAYRSHVKYLSERAKRNSQPAPTFDEKFKEQWLARHPLGYVEHRRAFDETGKYGRWLMGKNAVVKVNDIVFLHGGISEPLSVKSVSEINDRVRLELKEFSAFKSKLIKAGIIEDFFSLDEIVEEVKKEVAQLKTAKEPEAIQMAQGLESFLSFGSWYITHPDGPLWYRGYAEEQEGRFEPSIDNILANLKAKNIVVGHTVTPTKEITARFSKRVFLIDTGMLKSHYNGRCAALVIENDKFTAVYAKDNSRVVLLDRAEEDSSEATDDDAQEPAKAPTQPASPEAIEAFLKTARVTQMKGIKQGVTGSRKITLNDGKETRNAIFKTVDIAKDKMEFQMGGSEMNFKDTYKFDIAAYELDKLLEINMVPPTVQRVINFEKGSVQLWIENAMTEGDRMQKKLSAPDPDGWNREVYKIRIFDNLIYNVDRNLGNLLITPDWKIWMIDHSRAFRLHGQLKAEKDLVKFSRKLVDNLRKLNEAGMMGKLGKYLTAPEIRAVLKRRDLILRRMEKLIAEKGEAEVMYP